MRNLYILLFTISLSYTAQAQLGTDIFSVGSDDANNYGGDWINPNSGNGFSDWVFDTSSDGVGSAGRFIGSFSGALDVSGDSFGLFANNDPGAFSGATTTMPKSLEEDDSFTVSIGVNFRDGNKGFDLRDSSDNNIINFNVGSDVYNIAGTFLYENFYDANTVITFKFTQGATNVSWTAFRTGGSTATQSGTIANISPGTIDDIRFYNASAGFNNDGGEGRRNLYINTLEFSSLYTITENSTVASSGATTVPYLNIQSGAAVNIPSNSSVTVSGNLNNFGTLNLTSTSSEYPSLIPNTVSGSGTITYNRFVNSNTNGNDLVSAPVSGQTWGSFLTANGTALLDDGETEPTVYAFAPFDKSTGDFENYTDATIASLESGTGYRAATDTGTTLAFTGTISTGTETTAIVNSGPFSAPWNLIGNPFPSYLNVRAFLNNSANAALLDVTNVGIYGYDGDASNGWTILNLSNTDDSAVITPGQGFFVAAESDGTIEFTPAMRRIGSSDDFISGRNAELTYLKLQLSTATSNYKTDFYFNTNASLGLDAGYDAGVWGGSAPSFALYSHLVQSNTGVPMALQALSPTSLSDVTVPLGVNANQGEQLTFSISASTLPASVNVYLDDTVANLTTLLNNSDYVITPTTALSGTGRFFLRYAENSLSAATNSLNTIALYVAQPTRELVFNGNFVRATKADVYDIQGRLVASQALEQNLAQQRMDVSGLSSGIYIVKLNSKQFSRSEKVILR